MPKCYYLLGVISRGQIRYVTHTDRNTFQIEPGLPAKTYTNYQTAKSIFEGMVLNGFDAVIVCQRVNSQHIFTNPKTGEGF